MVRDHVYTHGNTSHENREVLCSLADGAAGALEEVARIVAQIRACWTQVRITLRGDAGFIREELMSWCEQQGVNFIFGLARNSRPRR